VELGRDVSSEIMDGTPDASRWLGLDRDSFANTVSIDQAQVMRVASVADQLQEQMQRAAASRGTDATAAQAIDRLVEFRRQAVGVDKVGARGPLRTAGERLRRAIAEREAARARHADYLERGAQVEAAERRVTLARRGVARVQAAIAVDVAERAARRARRASELSARHSQAPPQLADRDEAADLVAAALGAWQRRPVIPPLAGPTAAELEAEVTALPDAPAGDRTPVGVVVAAMQELDQAEEALRGLGPAPQSKPEPPAAARRPPAMVSVAAVLMAAATVLVLSGAAGVAAGLAGLALLIGTSGILLLRRRANASDPLAPWQAERTALDAARSRAAAAARDALETRGIQASGSVRQMWAEYQTGCTLRATQAIQADRAPSLHREIASRRIAEDAAEGAQRAIYEIEVSLRAAAERAGLESSGDPAVIAERLRAWQADYVAARRAGQVAVEEWRELGELLQGGTSLALAREALRLEVVAREALVQLGDELEPIPAGLALDRLLDDRREALAAAEREWHERKGTRQGIAIDLPNVAEAEEQVATAEAELSRVEALAATIDETLRLLRDAQDKVHRDLAPILAGSVRRWLPFVSAGAYADVTVDPATLAVRVKEQRSGQWRTATLLSEGTREQIYLLLRMGMAQHLVTTGETAPLLLDEVTAQSDAQRRLALLTVLHQVSAERQVIMFTHDAEVAAWAGQNLDAQRDRLVTLPAVTAPGSPGGRMTENIGAVPEREAAPVPA
jgi:hypothetical protein